MNKKKTPAIVTTLVLTLITSIAWIFFSVYRSWTQTVDPIVPRDVLLPLNPKLDEETLNEIQSKNYLESIPETFVEQSPIETVLEEEVQTIESTPVATTEAGLEEGL